MYSTAQSGRPDYTILHQWRDEGNVWKREKMFSVLVFLQGVASVL